MKKRILSFYDQLTLPNWFVPIILLGVSFVAFGLLSSRLGFYMDDWHHVYYMYTRGASGLRKMLLDGSNRPYAGWFYVSGFNILGFKPINWQIAALVIRWATASVFWFFFRSLWPKHQRQVLYVSLLFLVYPFFLMQPMAMGYSLHWMGFFLYALSLWLMLIAKRQPRKYSLPIIAFALLAEGLHLASSEFFSGMELLRPFILWVLVSREEKNILRQIGKAFLQWIPYLLVLMIYAYWRVFLIPLPPTGDRNTPIILYQLFAEPIKTFSQMAIIAMKDTSSILFDSWHQALSSDMFDLSSIFTRYVLLATGTSFLALYALLNKLSFQRSVNDYVEENKMWRREMLMLGFVALFVGPLPIWFIGKAISTHTNQMAATRFGLASMLGAALLLVALINFFITDSKKANAAVALVLALAIGVHLNNAHNYQNSWQKQVNFYQQFSQRVPGLEPNTAIVSAGEILPIMGEYPTAYAINTIYSQAEITEETPYWFFAIYSSLYGRIDDFYSGMPLERRFLLSDFAGNSKEILFISFEPERGQCLWVLRPEDSSLRLISALERKASLNSAIDRIQVDSKDARSLPPEIFVNEIVRNWCSYYQKADLARQKTDWDKVTQLWEEAQAKDKRPANGFEYIPFIEGYAHQGDWGMVKTLVGQADKVSKGMAPILCSTLHRIKGTTPSSVERIEILDNMDMYLGCQE